MQSFLAHKIWQPSTAVLPKGIALLVDAKGCLAPLDKALLYLAEACTSCHRLKAKGSCSADRYLSLQEHCHPLTYELAPAHGITLCNGRTKSMQGSGLLF